MEKEKIYQVIENSAWKNKNEQYLFELQKFMDLADNIEDKNMRDLIISQMLKCDKCVTALAEKIIKVVLDNQEIGGLC